MKQIKQYKTVIMLIGLVFIASCSFFDGPRRPSQNQPSFYELGYVPMPQERQDDDEKPQIICPVIYLENTSFAKLILNMNDYQVNFLREESSCHISPQINQSYIDITPVFQVRQEQRGARSVKFSYYVKTPDGNTTLYPEEISVPAKRQSYCHKGKTIRVKIPEKQKYYYPISMGLVIDPHELEYNNRYFDSNYEE